MYYVLPRPLRFIAKANEDASVKRPFMLHTTAFVQMMQKETIYATLSCSLSNLAVLLVDIADHAADGF